MYKNKEKLTSATSGITCMENNKNTYNKGLLNNRCHSGFHHLATEIQREKNMFAWDSVFGYK